jgi:hypothetical protein
MYTITQKHTRPDESLEFISMIHESISDDVREYWIANYKNTNKCIFVNSELSENKLERVVTMLWDSKASWQEFQNDPTIDAGLFIHMRKQREENGFTRELVSEEEV